MVFRLLPVIFTICVTESIFCCFKCLTSEINLSSITVFLPRYFPAFLAASIPCIWRSFRRLVSNSAMLELEFLKLQDILFKKNITFVALDLPTSIDLATNKLIATTLSGIAEFENNRRKDRQKQGIRAAQQQGKYTGRKSIINQTLIQKVKNLKENKNLSVTEISKVLGISRPTIYKILKEELNYVAYNRLVKNVNQEAVHETK